MTGMVKGVVSVVKEDMAMAATNQIGGEERVKISTTQSV